jgi:ribosomal protein S18 acetylase RimI-like enzyme
MRNEDVPAIRDITWRGWKGVTVRELVEKRYGPVLRKGWRECKTDEVLRTCRERPDCVLVAEVEGRVVGYATFLYSEDDGCGYVGNNCVDPDYRGKGIGSALNRAVIERLRTLGARVVMVTTLEHDLPARRVYEKNGFMELVKSVTYTLAFECAENHSDGP